ncbi:MAG: hypothetical protein LC663_04795, partial [Actinobacteria bacterium]|nr:hypothetical protein [Actinomycetota bacterium]
MGRGRRISVRVAMTLAASSIAVLCAAPAGAKHDTTPAPQSTNGNGATSNAGTTKIAKPSSDFAPNNEPKPGCVLRVDFYGFRAGTLDVTINVIPPTGRGIVATDTVVIPETVHGKTYQTSRT